jgi:nitrogen regulatory protein PII
MHDARKRIEIVVEAVRAEEVTDLLDRLGATGWTMLPVVRGAAARGCATAATCRACSTTC